MRTLATRYYRLLLVLRNTKFQLIQLIIIISRYCGDNHVLHLVYFSPYLRLFNILKYFSQQFTSMGKVTAQQGWYDIYRRFIFMIFATKISYLIYIQFFTYENIGLPVNYATNQLGDNQLSDRCRSGDNAPNILRVFRMCLFWLICTEDLCLLCCDRRQ